MSRMPINMFEWPPWLKVPESWNEPPKPAEPAPAKPKREKAVWRPMTAIEREAALALGRCRLPPWSACKRIAGQMAMQAQRQDPRITDKQAALLWQWVVKYRRQIGEDSKLVAHARKEIDK